MNKWDYKVVGKFNDIFYKDLLQKKHMGDGEKFIKTVNTPDNEESIEEELNTFFYPLVRGHQKFLLDSECINDLPVFVTKSDRVGYKGEGYNLIRGYETARFKPEKKFEFRQMIEDFASMNHEKNEDFLLWKIICFTSLIDRINVRISSAPGFGKDSIMDLINDLVGSIGIVQKPTIAKLEYLSLNKVLMVNELMNLSTQEYRDIEQYLLSVGAFKNSYTKRSRAGSQGKEDYDISKLSLVLSYNDVDCYPDPEAYFDKVQTKQIKERFLPFRFNGAITEVFPDIPDPEKEANNNKDYFVSVARTIKYFEENWRKELKPYSELNLGLTGRWKRNFDTISRFINLYARNEAEYKELCLTLYKKHMDYLEMVYESKNLNRFTLDDKGEMGFQKIDMEEEAIVEEVNVKEWKDSGDKTW
ncbi:MAG: hypothetical protein DRJ15_08705 [Bacteroidetes bacterium]|nr:MAG: hypothetical protein DRJ15_08705 [Bacteroidota bacterium]